MVLLLQLSRAALAAIGQGFPQLERLHLYYEVMHHRSLAGLQHFPVLEVLQLELSTEDPHNLLHELQPEDADAIPVLPSLVFASLQLVTVPEDFNYLLTAGLYAAAGRQPKVVYLNSSANDQELLQYDG